MSVQKAENGKITMFIKKLGKTSRELYTYKVGDCLENVIGPMGNPFEIKKYGNVAVCSDLVCGHAENYALCKALKQADENHVISMQTFPTKDMVYCEEELRRVSDEYYITTEDGSYGIKGHYRDVLKKGKRSIWFLPVVKLITIILKLKIREIPSKTEKRVE